MGRIHYIVIAIVILIIIAYSVYAGDVQEYRLLCDNAQNIKEYTSCVRLDTIINR